MKFLVVAALGATLLSSRLAAQPFPIPAQQPDLTRDQARQRADRLFEVFDANHDGAITPDEARSVGGKLMLRRAATGRDVAPGIGGHTLRYLEQAFAGMPSVNLQQFERAILAHFDDMDRDHDGILTAAERQQATLAAR